MDPISLAASVAAAVSAVVTLAATIDRFTKSKLRQHEESTFKTTILETGASAHAVVDIIFVHGLGWNSGAAWSSTDENGNTLLCWPKTELSHRLSVPSRVIAYDYDSEPPTAEYLANRTLSRQAVILNRHLAQLGGSDKSQHQIVFVAHGLGGLLVKNALVESNNSTDPKIKEIFESTAGVVFLETPHDSIPVALAGRLQASLTGQMKEKIDKRELLDYSTTLAYTLERFKPLAAGLCIQAFPEIETPRQRRFDSPGGDDQDEPSFHKTWTRRSNNRDLSKFSDPTDDDLGDIIKAVNRVCKHAVSRPTEKVLTAQPLLQDGGQGLSELGNGLPQHCRSSAGSDVGNNAMLDLLNQHCRRWNSSLQHSDNDLAALETWPIVVLYGPAGRGKTRTALQYAKANQGIYSSTLWVNASSRKSIELSFRDIVHRIGATGDSKSSSRASKRNGPADTYLGEGDDLSDVDLRTLIDMATEWLERPQVSKWLMVLDDLSLSSSYPHQPASVGQYDPHQAKTKSWKELVRLFPSASSSHGHIIITTRDDPKIPDGLKIKFESDEAASHVSTDGPKDDYNQVNEWWRNSEQRQKNSWALCLFLTDKKCSSVPRSTLDLAPDECNQLFAPNDTVAPNSFNRYYPDLRVVEKEDGTHVRLKRSSREKGFELLCSLKGISDRFLEDTAGAALGTISKALDCTHVQEDMIHNWDEEEQVVENCGAVVRHFNALFNGSGLPKPLRVSWTLLAAACERHSDYETAAEIYRLAIGTRSIDSRLDILLAAARAYQRDAKFDLAKDIYSGILSRDARDLPETDLMAVHHQFASLWAAQGMFAEAADEASRVLALEDPFGADVTQYTVTETVHDLVSYLAQSGRVRAAAALLQRLLTTLELSLGELHPSTTAALEGLATLWQQADDLGAAREALEVALRRRRDRLGDEHPAVLRCMSKLATVLDLQGQYKEAERMFDECLRTSKKILGPMHPALFGARENYALCLINRGKRFQAEKVLGELQSELETTYLLHPAGKRRRINELLDQLRRGGQKARTKAAVSRRNTMGVADLYVEDSDEED